MTELPKDKCFKCGKVRTGPWALLFSPPHESKRDGSFVCFKKHICLTCYQIIIKIWEF
jgi:hypothetical protein